MSTPANWFVFIGLASSKLCTLDVGFIGFFIQFVIWIVDSVAVTYIVEFIENKNVLFWLWFTTNALQTLLFEPILKRSLHFHPPAFYTKKTYASEEAQLKDIVHKYFIVTICYYVLHFIHIIFMFVVIFVSYSSPPAELNIAIAFTWIGSALSCFMMASKQKYLNDEIIA